tara:strand:- start:1308 stop:2072 length:765 start_codon:yes stop_codon:yes gene_type:complete
MLFQTESTMDIINDNLRISTMTQITKFHSPINLQNLFELFNISDTISYIEYADNIPKGEKKKKINKRKKDDTKKRKFFYNQVTIHVVKHKIVNVKIFNNGGVQMTGLKSKEQGEYVVNILKNLLQQHGLVPNDVSLSPIKIVLINSDFDFGQEINREMLHRLIVEENYYSSFEPIIYPGVNIKYYFNTNNRAGICQCGDICNGKGQNGNCKKITIAVFKSGKIIITGGQSIQQINTAYNFITSFLSENKDLIKI